MKRKRAHSTHPKNLAFAVLGRVLGAMQLTEVSARAAQDAGKPRHRNALSLLSGVAHHPVRAGSAVPHFAPLSLYGDTGGIGDLDPDAARAGLIGAVDLFRHDASAPSRQACAKTIGLFPKEALRRSSSLSHFD